LARVGLLGGTFNPPHVGHLVCAEEARNALRLDRVLLLPVHTPPHKDMQADPGPEVRLELCRLAVGDAPGIEVSAHEIDRGGRSYTVDTLRALHDARPEDDLTFIAGADQAAGLPAWREPAAVLELAELAVAEREAVQRDDVLDELYGLPGVPERVHFFSMPRIDVSSSLIRRRVAEGRPIRWLVPEAVEREIAARGLYRAQVGAR
jgi:nicotinate-nucleotide adenylyltransferase